MSIFKKIYSEAWEWLWALMSAIPGQTGALLRVFVLRFRLKKIGGNVLLGRWVEVTGHAAIEIGDNVMIADGCSLNAHNGGVLKLGQSISVNKNSCLNAADGGEITIGDNVLIAQNVVLRASDHEFKSLNSPINAQGHRPGRIEVDSDVWIAANSVVTSNVKIGSHSIVGAGAVVTMNVENNSIVGGVPARLIKKRVAWEAQKQDLV